MGTATLATFRQCFKSGETASFRVFAKRLLESKAFGDMWLHDGALRVVYDMKGECYNL